MKIFITGCAKTGTTLIRRLFNTFDIVVCNNKEISLQSFIKSQYQVGKRTYGSIFSGIMSDADIKHNIELIKTHNIKIVNVVRNKADVLKSEGGYVSEERYNNAINQALKYIDYIDYTIKYEELLNEPNSIQQEIQNKFGFSIYT